jgi:hypothetical protein
MRISRGTDQTSSELVGFCSVSLTRSGHPEDPSSEQVEVAQLVQLPLQSLELVDLAPGWPPKLSCQQGPPNLGAGAGAAVS